MKHSEQDAATQALGEREKPKGPRKYHVHEVHVRRGHKGGYIAKHHLKDQDGENHPMHGRGDHPEYPMASHKELLAHMQEHMPEEAEEAAGEKQGEPAE